MSVKLPADLTGDIPDELVVTFRKPITLGSESYTQMVLREPTAGEMIETDKFTKTEADVVALTLVSGLPRPVIEKLGLRDFNKGSVYLGRFLP